MKRTIPRQKFYQQWSLILAVTNSSDFISQLRKAFDAGISRVNEKAVSQVARVRKWVVLPKDFSMSGGEIGKENLFMVVFFGIVPSAQYGVYKYEFFELSYISG